MYVLYLYRGLSSTSLEKGKVVNKKSEKRWHRKEGVLSKKVMSLTQILVSSKKKTFKNLSVYLR